MKDQKRNLEHELLEGIREIKRTKGKRYSIDVPSDVRQVRKRLSLTQDAFAALMGVSIRTLQDWEQHRRKPSGPAYSLLRIACRYPQAFLH